MCRGMWENGWTPGSGIRMLGPYGPKLVSGYARNRCSSPAELHVCSGQTERSPALFTHTTLRA